MAEFSPIQGMDKIVADPGVRTIALGQAARTMDQVYAACGVLPVDRNKIITKMINGRHHDPEAGNPNELVKKGDKPTGVLARRQVAASLSFVGTLGRELSIQPISPDPIPIFSFLPRK